MNADIRIKVSFKGHRKRHNLERLLGTGKGATDYLLDLWLTAAQQRPDGNLKGWNEKDIAVAAGYRGKPQKLVDSLLESGFLDRDGEGYRLHDWEEHQPWCCGAPRRSEQARRAAEGRWREVGQGSEEGGRGRVGDTSASGRTGLGGGLEEGRRGSSDPISESKSHAQSINEHMPLSVSSPSPNRILTLPKPIPQPIPEPEELGKALFFQLPLAVRSFLEGYGIELSNEALNDLLSWCEKLTEQDILTALKDAVKHNAYSWQYVQRILTRMESETPRYETL